MFDPFKDFDTAGYLRNFEGEKDLGIVKVIEHEVFRANLPEAVAYLARQKHLAYRNFLKVHHILFQGFYPWAGQDRETTAPESSINKGAVVFAHPSYAMLAVNEGLRIGQNKQTMRSRPGEVMGLFAYGHPFLDGNGRTMQLVHADLCRRAGFWISWKSARVSEYLLALTDELSSPGKGILDSYLIPSIVSLQS